MWFFLVGDEVVGCGIGWIDWVSLDVNQNEVPIVEFYRCEYRRESLFGIP